MKHQLALQEILRTRMGEAQAKNPSFSLRALARKLGISPAMTSRVLSGQRQMSVRLARRILEALLLDPQEQAEILALFPAPRVTRSAKGGVPALDPRYLRLSADQFRMISEWHYLAILSLFKTEGFQDDPSWIAGRLGVSSAKVRQALERLRRLGLVEQGPGGRLVRTSPRYRTSDDVLNLSVRRAHFETLELARGALESEPVGTRDFTSLTLAFPADRIAEAKVMIREFQDAFDARFEDASSRLTQVYRLCMGFFPLTKNINKENV